MNTFYSHDPARNASSRTTHDPTIEQGIGEAVTAIRRGGPIRYWQKPAARSIPTIGESSGISHVLAFAAVVIAATGESHGSSQTEALAVIATLIASDSESRNRSRAQGSSKLNLSLTNRLDEEWLLAA
jgi:hypothetical protein